VTEDPNTPILEALVDAFLDSWNRHDAGAIAATFAPDADLVNFRGRRFSGRDGIARFFTRIFGQNFKESRVTSQERRIRPVGETAAAVDSIWTLAGARDPTGATRPERRCLLDGTAEKNPTGGWWFVVAHLRELPPDADASGHSPPAGGPPAATAPPD
jgi:uncharacterized protein (TIGR02246 family)